MPPQTPLSGNILQSPLTTIPVNGRPLNLPARPTWGSADLWRVAGAGAGAGVGHGIRNRPHGAPSRGHFRKPESHPRDLVRSRARSCEPPRGYLRQPENRPLDLPRYRARSSDHPWATFASQGVIPGTCHGTVPGLPTIPGPLSRANGLDSMDAGSQA